MEDPRAVTLDGRNPPGGCSRRVGSVAVAGPFERPMSMAPRRPHPAGSFVLGWLASLVLASGPVGCNKPPAPVAGPAPPTRSVGKALSDAECLAAGEKMSKAVNSGDAAALDRMIDWESLGERSTAGIEAPEQFRSGFLKGLDMSRSTGKGISAAIVDAVKKGGTYTLIHSHVQDGRPRLLFRLVNPESGVNYHDFVIARRPDGAVKAVDMYVYLSGEMLSETFRRLYIQAAAQQSGGLIGRLTGADQEYVKYFTKLTEMGEARRNGKNAEVLSIYEASPPELKKEKAALLIRVQAAQGLGDDEQYKRAIEAFRAEFPRDASIDIISVDYHLMKKEYREAIDCVDRLDRAVLGDPHLQTIRANIHVEQDDLAAARADVKKALEADPDLADAYWSLATISLKDKDHDETLRTLRTLRDKFRIDFADLTTQPPYKDFVASPQFQDWLKDGKEPAGPPKE